MTTASHTPISDEVASLHQRMADQPLSDSMAAFGAEQRALEVAGLPATVARPGTAFPTAELLTRCRVTNFPLLTTQIHVG